MQTQMIELEEVSIAQSRDKNLEDAGSVGLHQALTMNPSAGRCF